MAEKKDYEEAIKTAAEVAEKEREEGRMAKRYDKLNDTVKTKPQKPEEVEKPVKKSKKVDGVVMGKPSIFSRIKVGLLPEGVSSFKDYVIDYMLIPYLDGAIHDALGAFLPGSGDRRDRRDSKTYISYDSKYGSSSKRSRERETRPLRNISDWRDILFTNARTARTVLDALRDDIDRYGCVSVLTYLDYCGQNGTPQDDDYGWYDLKDVRIKPLRGNVFKLTLPTPVAID